MRLFPILRLVGLGMACASPTMLSAQKDKPEWLDIQVSGRNCPQLQASRLTSDSLELEFDQAWSLPVGSPRRFDRGFCQVIIRAKTAAKNREELIFTALELSGQKQTSAGEALHLGYTVYRQGDENHWERKVDVSVAEGTNRSWTERQDISPQFKLSCQDNRAMNVKIDMTNRVSEAAAQRSADQAFQLAPVWRLHLNRKPCD